MHTKKKVRLEPDTSTQPCTSTQETLNAVPAEPQRPPAVLDLMRKTKKVDFGAFLEEARECYDENTIDDIQRFTIRQSQSEDWFNCRRGMATSTLVHSFKTKAKKLKTEPRPHNINGLYKAIMRQSRFKSAAMQKGIEREAEAREMYGVVMVADGHEAVVSETGLIIWKKFPLIGCSPDRIVNFKCQCCRARKTLLEIKCPVKVTNSFSKDNPKPEYGTQMQVQMGVVGISICDFFVYESPHVWRFLTVPFDEARFQECCEAVKSIYSEYLFDALRTP